MSETPTRSASPQRAATSSRTRGSYLYSYPALCFIIATPPGRKIMFTPCPLLLRYADIDLTPKALRSGGVGATKTTFI